MSQLTDEQVGMLSKAAKEGNENNESIQKLNEAKEKSREELLENIENETTKNVVAKIDPSSGQVIGTEIAHGYGFDKPGTLFDYFIDNDDDELDGNCEPDTEFNIEQVQDAAKEVTIRDSIAIGDIYKLRDLLIKKNQKGEVKFSDLPETFKEEINNKVTKEIGRGMSSQYFNMCRNMMANELIENVYTSVVQKELEEVCMDLDTSIKNLAAEELGTERSKQNEQYHNMFILKFPELAQTKYKDDPEKAALLMGVSEAFKQSQSLELMYEAYKKGMKIRKIDVEKLDKAIRNFEMKYEKSKFTIRDLRQVPDVLRRHVSPSYTDKVIDTFVAVFCKYTDNMKPENVDEHTFIYYFIDNILSLNVPATTQDDKDFNDNLIKSINRFLNEIKSRIA